MGIGASPVIESTGSAVTTPRWTRGPTRASSSARSSGRTSTTWRPVDSANSAVARSPVGEPVDRRAQPAGDAQLGQGDRQPALADVVARLDETGADRRVQPAVPLRRVGVRLRDGTWLAHRAEHEVEMAAGELGLRAPEEQQHVARLGELGRHGSPDVWHVSDGRDHQRRRNGVAPAVGADVLVVQRVLAGHERCAVGDGGVVATADRGDQLAERARPSRIAPREVVEQGDAVGIGADRDDVADRLVDDGVGHRLGVVQPVPGIDADADGDAVGVAGVGEHDTVGRRVPLDADERAHRRAAPDLVVVAVDRRRLGGDVAVGEQGEQRAGRIGDGAPDRLSPRCGQLGRHPSLRATVVEERRVEVEHHVTVVAHDEVSVAGEGAEVGQLDAVAGAAGTQFLEPVRWDGDDHPLLRLRQPDLPRRQAGVLERDGRQLDVGADAVGHLADRRGQTARAAVGDRRPEVVGAGQHVDEQLLGDRVADLHARPGDLARGGVHRGAGERGAADAVAAGATAEHDDAIAGERSGGQRSFGGHADAAAEHQRVGREAGVVEDGAGDGRQADLVAVVGDAVDHAVADAPRVERTVGQVGDWQVGRAEAQHVGHGDGPVRRAEHVADHAPDTGVGAAEGFDR